MGPSLAFRVVDVFTGVAFAGNPLAVVLDAEELTTGQMQTLAREFNLSETAFPVPPDEGADYGLRIFTPAVELPFAGHPSVGAAWVLHDLGRLPAGERVQSCGAGLLSVMVDAMITLTGAAPSYSPPRDSAPLLAAVGLDPEDLVGTPARSAGAGIDFGYLYVRPDALARAVGDMGLLRALGGAGVSVVGWDGSAARARVFAGGVGVAEDPATGSAALGLGVFLAASGLLADGWTDYVVTQGVEMGRPSTLTCRVLVEAGQAVRTTVSGSVVPIASGEIRVPPVT